MYMYTEQSQKTTDKNFDNTIPFECDGTTFELRVDNDSLKLSTCAMKTTEVKEKIQEKIRENWEHIPRTIKLEIVYTSSGIPNYVEVRVVNHQKNHFVVLIARAMYWEFQSKKLV